MTGTPASENEPPLDALLAALADERRRRVLRVLNETSTERLTVSTLAEELSGQTDAAEPGDEHRQRLRTVLHHVHLPKLDECGLVRYDAETKQVQNTVSQREQELLGLVEAYETGRLVQS